MSPISKLIPCKKAHFVGIGGAGMSALAQLLLSQGFFVSGSDIKASNVTSRLESQGAKVKIGHSSENIEDVDIIVFSSCIPSDNPEIIEAHKRKIPVLPRALLLANMMEDKCSIAVAGAHGKTTTSALIAYLLNQSGYNPSYAIGADVRILGGNARYGQGGYFVAEADESDGSFLFLKPDYAVVTNIDKEHLDFYKNLKSIIQTYGKFISNVSSKGKVFCCGDDKNICKALEFFKGNVLTYGLNKSCDLYAFDMHFNEMETEFKCIYKNKLLDTFKLKIPGAHNVLNALAVIAVAREFGIDNNLIKQVLASFSGANRRFQIKECAGGITIVDDYAHHPTEISATLQAAKAWNKKRIVGVFQPHRYSRTKFLRKEFGSCFKDTDRLVITDIYAASETPIQGIDARTICDEVMLSGHKHVRCLPREKISDYILSIVRDGDLLMMMGAGDIGNLVDELEQRLALKNKVQKK
ncbi:MAG: UDP-N-acetylmuramate--L-alanine ligase [Candidatus Omnitrophica bacterium]|nr:UDP-N-acetylmuramate--L-alanine ligase [Candidatus Omnitrophota bacterium]